MGSNSRESLLRWSYISTLSTASLQLIAATVITRFLKPSDYGLAAMAMVCSNLASYFTQLGMDRAIIQRPDLTEGNIQAALTASLATGLVGFTGLAAASHGLALYFREPRLPGIIIAFGLNLLFQSFAMIAGGLLRRELQIRKLAICDIAAYLLSTFGLGLPLAMKGYGVWALVASNVSQTLFAAIGYYIARRHSVRLTFVRENFRDITGFGAKVSVTTMVEALSGSADTLVLGRLVSPQVLGLYNRSLTLSMQPIYALSTGLSRVFHPSIARAAERTLAECRSMLQSSEQQLMGVILPVCIGAAVAAPTLIPAIFGRQWAGSIPVYQALCIDAALDASFHLPTIQLEVLSRFRAKLIVQVLYGMVLAASAVVAAPRGIVMVAYVFVVLQFLRTLWLHWLSARSLGTSLFKLLNSWVPGALCGAIVGGVVYTLQTSISRFRPDTPLLFRLLLLIFAGLAVGTLLYRMFFYDSMFQPWASVFGGVRGRTAVVQIQEEVGVA
ncbi:lipopolysaccharide biosynthesis protein [Terriglobus roseus]|nr:lipopolysaccharide biosynthesis protein [Terriglobus roseus]